MVTTLPVLLLFAIIICVCTGIARGDTGIDADTGSDSFGSGGSSSCAADSDCWSSFDDIKAQIEGDATEIPVCHSETIEFMEAIDASRKKFHLFTANCDGSIKDDELLESATFIGNEIFSATNTDSEHDITISGVNFYPGDGSSGAVLDNEGPGTLYVSGAVLDNGGTGTLSVSGCTFQGPFSVKKVGHAIRNHVDASVIVKDCSFDGYGGAISNRGQITIKESTFSRNTVDGHGGAIYNRRGTMTIESCIFTSNGAWSGGAIYDDGGTTEIKKSKFFDNKASSFGGAIAAYAGNLKMSENTFDRNYADCDGNASNPSSLSAVARHTVLAVAVPLDSAWMVDARRNSLTSLCWSDGRRQIMLELN